jgi:hypothetical protein
MKFLVSPHEKGGDQKQCSTIARWRSPARVSRAADLTLRLTLGRKRRAKRADRRLSRKHGPLQAISH